MKLIFELVKGVFGGAFSYLFVYLFDYKIAAVLMLGIIWFELIDIKHAIKEKDD